MVLVLYQDHVAVRHKGLRLAGHISWAEPVDLYHDLEPRVGEVRRLIDSRVNQAGSFAVENASGIQIPGYYVQ